MQAKKYVDIEKTKESFFNNKRGFIDRFLIISQTNVYYKMFQYFVSIVCIISSFMYALFAGFRYDIETNNP